MYTEQEGRRPQRATTATTDPIFLFFSDTRGTRNRQVSLEQTTVSGTPYEAECALFPLWPARPFSTILPSAGPKRIPPVSKGALLLAGNEVPNSAHTGELGVYDSD